MNPWPMPVQVLLALVIAEFGLYSAHRLAHEHLALWRFHALHHSVTRLWVVNTGRFHFLDSLFKIVVSQAPLYLLGAPLDVFLWVGAVTRIYGALDSLQRGNADGDSRLCGQHTPLAPMAPLDKS
jgi:sterol desaturase/sphingolipid hydroxylase (fatty acid hydroxylase superfamily)